MGKCSKCGKKIEYNNFTVVNGIVYHRECAPKEALTVVVNTAKLDFNELAKELSKIPGTIIGDEAMKQNDTKCFSKNTGLGNKALKSKKRRKSKR